MRIPLMLRAAAMVSLMLISLATVAISAGSSEGGWKPEFEAVCGATDTSLTLTKAELADFVGRCDRLKPLIEAEEEPARKIHLKRLKSCRDLFAFMLETAEGGAGEKAQAEQIKAE